MYRKEELKYIILILVLWIRYFRIGINGDIEVFSREGFERSGGGKFFVENFNWIFFLV